jgi:hypothetical protein
LQSKLGFVGFVLEMFKEKKHHANSTEAPFGFESRCGLGVLRLQLGCGGIGKPENQSDSTG